MTTASFTQFVRTVEGQFQVSLGHALAKESSEDNISRMLPLKDPILILNKEKNRINNYNPNMRNKTLALICNYVQCHPVGIQCSTTVRPTGHCCDICAGVMRFSSMNFTPKNIMEAIENTIAENNLSNLLNYSIDCIGEEDIVPRYQIAVFPVANYDDTVVQIFLLKLHNKLNSRKGTSMDYFSVEYDWSRLDHSYARASKIAGFLTFCLLVLVVAVVFWKNSAEGQRLRAFLFSHGSTPFRVVWHQGKGNDEDVVHLVNSEEDMANAEEDEYPPSPAVLTPTPLVFEQQTEALQFQTKSEGLSSIELKLID